MLVEKEIPYDEILGVIGDCQAHAAEGSPMNYALGRNLVSLGRTIKQITGMFDEDKSAIQKRLCIKGADGEPAYILKPDANGIMQRHYDFTPENNIKCGLEIEDLSRETYLKNADGSPVKIPVKVYMISKEIQAKLNPDSIKNIAWIQEHLFVTDTKPE